MSVFIAFALPSLSDLSPTDVSPAVNLVCAELSLRDRRDRLDIFLRKGSRSGFLTRPERGGYQSPREQLMRWLSFLARSAVAGLRTSTLPSASETIPAECEVCGLGAELRGRKKPHPHLAARGEGLTGGDVQQRIGGGE